MPATQNPSHSPVDPKRGGWLHRLARLSVLQGSRRRSLWLLSAVSVGDFFVPALPTQTSVIALGMLQPQRAAWIALAFAAAAATGAALLALIMLTVNGYAQQFGSAQLGDEWLRLTALVREYGVWAVLAASIFPTPPRLTIAAALLAGATAGLVIAAVFVGKLIWFGLFLLLLIRAPQWLVRVPLLGRGLTRFERFRAQVLAEESGRV